jgi:hypothetical protein
MGLDVVAQELVVPARGGGEMFEGGAAGNNARE